jgi:hypothetical protein
MSKKATNLDVVTEIVKEKYPFQSRQDKLEVLKLVVDKFQVSPNNASVYVAKAIKRIEGKNQPVIGNQQAQQAMAG